jgi:hypothetical protein
MIVLLISASIPAHSLLAAQAPTKSSQKNDGEFGSLSKKVGGSLGGTQDRPVFVTVVPFDAEQGISESKPVQNEILTWEKWAAIANVVMAFLTLIVASVTVALWWSARDATRRQLRAYVDVHQASIDDVADPSKRMAVVVIRNSGQTPAKEVIFWCCIMAGEYPLKFRLSDSPPKEKVTEISRADLPPDGRVSVSVPLNILSVLEESELQAGRGAIYVFGQITYRDIFDKHRVTTFRLSCRGEQLRSGSLSQCGDGNRAD